MTEVGNHCLILTNIGVSLRVIGEWGQFLAECLDASSKGQG